MPEFKITKNQSGSLDTIEIVDQEQQVRLKVLPSFGGNIARLTMNAGGESLTVIDGYQTIEAAQEQKGYRGAFLCPFPNRILEGKYTFEGVQHQLPINRPKENCAIHGLFTQTRFELVSEDTDDCSAEFTIRSVYDGSYRGYPFPCEILINYKMASAGEFRSIVTVINRGQTNMPLGIGWHPYFSLGCEVDQLKLRLPASEILLTGPGNRPTGSRAKMNSFQTPELIACSLFDTTFQLKPEGTEAKVAVTEITNERDRWQLRIAQLLGDGGYNFTQLYIPPDRRSIAIEPMTCPADSFNSGIGLNRLAPEESISSSFSVTLNRIDR